MTVVAVMVAGTSGAAARFVVDHVTSRLVGRRWPVGTLVVNVAGSAAAGVLAGAVARHGLDDTVRTAVGTGFLGAFTTFSTFAVETTRLAEEHDGATAATSVAATLVLGIAAAALGYAAMVLP